MKAVEVPDTRWGRGRPWHERLLAVAAYTYLAVLPVQIPITTTFNLAVADIVLALGLLVVGYRLTVTRRLVSIWHGILIMVFAGGSLVSFLRFGELSTWGILNKTVGFLGLLAGYLLIGNHAKTFDKVVQTVHVLVGSISIYNAIALIAFFGGIQNEIFNNSTEFERLAGGYVDPNAYGGLLVPCLVAYLAFRKSTANRFNSLMDYFVVVSLSAGIIFTLSRSAWLALGAALVVLFVVNSSSRVAIAASVLAAVVGFAALPLLQSSERFVEIASRSNTIVGRMELNESALREVSLDPLGMGIGGFTEKYGTIVHNTPLWFAADLGFIGVVAFLGLSFWVLKQLLLAYSLHEGAEKAVVLGLGLAHVSMLTLSLAVEAFYQRHWWVIMALIATSTRPSSLKQEQVA